ncbi:alpha/beta fold hydrolase [Anditalea andensis]|uniref:AB hydrolase-1 domain-containing protein n=1 Tax=Anditalea andensis TaxID=1048983 RepID=A0A074KZU6_9BACT|nr:alpha/beta hydrolase [Anditalea andensis]KEO73735.1 hypothetical protein EL17_09460 [Anditalea andensis]
MKKFLLNFLAIIGALFLTVIVMIFALAEPVPDRAEVIIEEVLSGNLPEQIHGDTGRVAAGDLQIWYESIPAKGEPKGTILLIMGLGGNALEWPLYFVQPLVEAGYQVVRFDNRGTGLSSSSDVPFSMEDMADDAFLIMDNLNIPAAHIMGMSMGGMIAQMMAIDQPQRVSTLTLFISSAHLNDPGLPSTERGTFAKFIATGIRHGIPHTQMNALKSTISVRKVVAQELSDRRIRSLVEQGLYNENYRKGFNPKAFQHQIQALNKLESRYGPLSKLNIPTLVLHGTHDPLIPVEHGVRAASIIPGARLVLLEGMGHDLSDEHTEEIHKEMFSLMKKDVFDQG